MSEFSINPLGRFFASARMPESSSATAQKIMREAAQEPKKRPETPPFMMHPGEDKMLATQQKMLERRFGQGKTPSLRSQPTEDAVYISPKSK